MGFRKKDAKISDNKSKSAVIMGKALLSARSIGADENGLSL